MKADYKHLFRAANLTMFQKQVFTSLCLAPTAHPYSAVFRAKYKLTPSVVRSALQALHKHDLIIKDSSGVWRLRNPGMQAWWYVVQADKSIAEIESLRFGEWNWSASMSTRIEQSRVEVEELGKRNAERRKIKIFLDAEIKRIWVEERKAGLGPEEIGDNILKLKEKAKSEHAWLEKNREAIEEYKKHVEQHGVFGEKFRVF